jgi:CHAD domain-containing protein
VSKEVEGSAKLETEIKFKIPNYDTFAVLSTLRQLGEFHLKPVGIKKVVDRYLDTANRAIIQAGYACRVRTADKKSTLSLKSLTPPEGDTHRRQEIEVEIKSEQPQSWATSQAKEMIDQMAGEAPLEPLFTLFQTRHKNHVFLEGRPLIEMSVDKVSLTDPDQVDYFELEAELLEAGSEADLRHFVETLQTKWALQVELRSKFERAYEAHFENPNGAFIVLDETEKSALEIIAAQDDNLLSKRALIILMSQAGATPENIAREVALTPRTVKQWRARFSDKRLAIFPAKALPKPKETPKPAKAKDTPLGQTHPLVGSKAKKTKPKKKKGSVKYQQRRIGLKPTDTLAEAGRKVFGFHFARMLEHESGTRSGEKIEALHDMRVATRRMRAAFTVFGEGFLKKTIKLLLLGLKETGHALGPVRDLDVFMQQIQTYQQTLPAERQADLQPLLTLCQERHSEARAQMLAYLDSKKYLRFKRDFLNFVKIAGLGDKVIPQTMPPTPHQLRHVVPGLIYTYYEEVRAYEMVLDTAPIETLHQLRISLKGLRYTLEYLAEVLGQEKEMLIAEVKAMQDHLGEMNDADVAVTMLREFLENWETQQLHLPLAERQSPSEIVTYMNVNLEKRHQLVITFPAAWKRFNRPEVRQNLAQAIAML